MMQVRGGKRALTEMHYFSLGFFIFQVYSVIFCKRKKERKMVKRVEESDKILVCKDSLNLGCVIGEAGCSGQGWMSNGPNCPASPSVFQ